MTRRYNADEWKKNVCRFGEHAKCESIRRTHKNFICHDHAHCTKLYWNLVLQNICKQIQNFDTQQFLGYCQRTCNEMK